MKVGVAFGTQLLACLLCAAQAGAQGLTDELRALIETNPRIQAAAKAVDAAAEGVTDARSGWLPSVRLQGDYGRETIDSPTRRNVGSDTWARPRDSASLVVSQHLFDGFATDAAVGAAQRNHDISRYGHVGTRQNVMLEGIAAYLDVMRYAQLVTLGRDNERNIREQMRLEDERVKKGRGLSVDVLLAKQRLQVAKERRVAYEGALANAVARYMRLFGHAPDIARMTEPQPPVARLPATLEDAVARAMNDNPIVVGTETGIALADERRRLAESGFYPVVDLVGRATYQDDVDLVAGTRRDWAVLVQLNWELFSGFRTKAAVAQAAIEHSASKDNFDQAARTASEQARSAWSTLMTARERLDLLQNAVALAEEVWEARKVQREGGTITVMDVLDAESAIYSARINYVAASYDMRLAAYQLLHAVGDLELDRISTR